MASSWWAVIFNAPTGKDFAVTQAASAAEARVNIGAAQTTVITAVKGPYATQAAAQAAGRAAVGGGAPPPPSGGTGAPAAGGGRYSYAQLEQLWINAGGSPSLAPLMAAIAEAESGGNPNAVGPVGEKGLWQVYGAVWGNLATFDPVGNAKAAVHIEQVQGLGAWTTYTSGAYKRFLNGSTTPDPNVPTGPGGGGSGGGTGGSGGGSTTPFPGDVGATLTGNTSKCLVGGGTFVPCLLNASQARALIGGMLLAAGALIMATGLAMVTVQSVGGQAIKATPAGIAASLSGVSGKPRRPGKPPPTPAKDKLPPVISE